MDGVVRFLGSVNLLAFFTADLYFAYVLSQLKKDHPSIDDCAPPEVGGNTNASGYGGLGASNSPTSPNGIRSYQDAPNDPVSLVLDAARNRGNGEIAVLFNGIHPTNFLHSRSAGVYTDVEAGNADSEMAHQRQRVVHLAVIVASFCAPFLSLLQILFPSAMKWSMFHTPTWLGYLATVPALVAVVIYTARALRIGSFVEVSKAQWLSLVWFRLDMMVVMAFLLLIGWGDWLVFVCLMVVGLYLAFRLLQTERRLADIVQQTQLINHGNNDGVEMGVVNGAGVVRSAILASEQYNSYAAGSRTYGYNNPHDVFEGRVERGDGDVAGTVGSSYGGVSGSSTAKTGATSSQRQQQNFEAYNNPTDSESETAARGSPHYNNISGNEAPQRSSSSGKRNQKKRTE